MAQVTLEQGTGKSNFSIVGADSKAVICFDNEDAIVVRKSVDLFVDDVCRVTGHTLKVFGTHPDKVSARYAIIVGTIGKSQWIKKLASDNKIDTTTIAGGWERYLINLNSATLL